MNENDMNRLNELNKRFPGAILTGFKIVDENTPLERVIEDIECDVKILGSTCVENKYVHAIIVRDDVIDLRCQDNGTYITYFFTDASLIEIEDVAESLRAICDIENIILKSE